MSETPKWIKETAQELDSCVHNRAETERIIAKHSPVEAMENALRTIQAAFEACDSELYCEENCTANRNDKNFCSCNRRDRFGALIEAISQGESALALARGSR